MVLYVGFVPEHCQQDLTGRGLRLGFLQEEDVFPLHALPFGFWFMMMNPGFIPSDDAVQEVITFVVAPLQNTTAHCWQLHLCPSTYVWAPSLWKLCRTRECHTLNNRPYLHWRPVVMRFLLFLYSLVSARIISLPSSCFLSVAEVDCSQEHLASITFVRPFLDISAHKNFKTPRCSSSVQSERHTDMFTTP